jgi:hypothetical protein
MAAIGAMAARVDLRRGVLFQDVSVEVGLIVNVR